MKGAEVLDREEGRVAMETEWAGMGLRDVVELDTTCLGLRFVEGRREKTRDF